MRLLNYLLAYQYRNQFGNLFHIQAAYQLATQRTVMFVYRYYVSLLAVLACELSFEQAFTTIPYKARMKIYYQISNFYFLRLFLLFSLKE